jgi:hypothetical protein
MLREITKTSDLDQNVDQWGTCLPRCSGSKIEIIRDCSQTSLQLE